MALQPITPDRAVQLYLTQRKPEVAKATYYSHSSRLKKFTEWCATKKFENLNNLTGRDLFEFRLWRREDGNLAPMSEKTQMTTLRVFIKWAESIDAVEPDLHVKVQAPSLSKSDTVRDDMLDGERAKRILDYLSKYEYASARHITLALLWHTMLRRGSARALDLADVDLGDQSLAVKHREGTPLKNQEAGERYVALSDWMCELLGDWTDQSRPDTQDDMGRDPLLATAHGRIHSTTIQKYVYSATRPCDITGSCPHGREIDSCEAAQRSNDASGCPSSVSPHAVRRGAITHSLKNGVPARVVSDRANVGMDVLEQHYDRRSEREKMETRRSFLFESI